MKIAFFDTHRFEKETFESVNKGFGHEISYLDPRLSAQTATLAKGFPVVCAFANDHLDAETLKALAAGGTKLIALRSAGYNHVDLKVAESLNLPVVRVPAYSPYAVAEHAVCLMQALNRKLHRAYLRVREGNFSLDGLVGFDLHGKTVGVVGTGKIGGIVARILHGFGCHVLAFDLHPDPILVLQKIATYVPLNELYRRSKIITLHVPLTADTKHLIGVEALARMPRGVFLINTGRGALIDTSALIQALKSGHVGAAGLDVYEEEENFFFKDLSESVIQDDTLARLMTFPNVLIMSHQGFLTEEALHNIAVTTLENVRDFEQGNPLINEVKR